MTKRKNKNIIISQEAYDLLQRRYDHYKKNVLPQYHIKIRDNLTIVDNKIFITTVEEEEDEHKRK